MKMPRSQKNILINTDRFEALSRFINDSNRAEYDAIKASILGDTHNYQNYTPRGYRDASKFATITAMLRMVANGSIK